MSLSPVHPRVCGELRRRRDAFGCRTGSSPRVRGTPLAPSRRQNCCRFIPACAGNSPNTVSGSVFRDGSSPRVRGTLRGSGRRAEAGRFIPACAGNSEWSEGCFETLPVHPRVCGELIEHHLAAAAEHGSSPRVRGTPEGLQPPSCQSPVHPRVCGELGRLLATVPTDDGSSPRVRGTRLVPIAGLVVGAGSSPRVRGTQQRCPLHHVPRRFIPACAGNSTAAASAGSAFAVHPRVCGELAAASPCAASSAAVHPRVCGELQRAKIADLVADGSSPRVRGTRGDDVPRGVNGRFIPACAGNSSGWLAPDSRNTGSSPRVRGTRRRDPPRAPAGLRFIPACAGNSTQKKTRP